MANNDKLGREGGNKESKRIERERDITKNKRTRDATFHRVTLLANQMGPEHLPPPWQPEKQQKRQMHIRKMSSRHDAFAMKCYVEERAYLLFTISARRGISAIGGGAQLHLVQTTQAGEGGSISGCAEAIGRQQ